MQAPCKSLYFINLDSGAGNELITCVSLKPDLVIDWPSSVWLSTQSVTQSAGSELNPLRVAECGESLCCSRLDGWLRKRGISELNFKGHD